MRACRVAKPRTDLEPRSRFRTSVPVHNPLRQKAEVKRAEQTQTVETIPRRLLPEFPQLQWRENHCGPAVLRGVKALWVAPTRAACENPRQEKEVKRRYLEPDVASVEVAELRR
ncbi:hypothetical protein RRG08_067139 [Elysia crispata]|uniref:Uncharacterized protein n=1 Tax=Elysia crispata TaxID=231223 RepID=A0AAE1DG46_9GAST|nr:hypothetical protein RRG08_067139 [Elysia crispata]